MDAPHCVSELILIGNTPYNLQSYTPVKSVLQEICKSCICMYLCDLHGIKTCLSTQNAPLALLTFCVSYTGSLKLIVAIEFPIAHY